MLGILEMRGPPLSSVQSGGELGISSKTPAAFPEDIIRVSNSLQTLQMLLLLQCVSVSVCTHTSILWLSSQNWGQIALRCRYFGIRRFFFADSPLHSTPHSHPSSSILLPCYLSHPISSRLVPFLSSYPFTPCPSFIPSRPPLLLSKGPPLQSGVRGREMALCLYMYRIDYFQLSSEGTSPISKPVL